MNRAAALLAPAANLKPEKEFLRMTSSKKLTTATPESLRAAADAAVAAWRAAVADAASKGAWHREIRARADRLYALSAGQQLELARTEIAELEAEKESKRAELAVLIALEAAEIAEGDELAIARSPKFLQDDLRKCDTAEQEAENRLSDVRRFRDERIARGRSADRDLIARRRAAGLPWPRPLPVLPEFILDGTRSPASGYPEQIAKYISTGEASTKSDKNERRLAELQAREIEIMASAEADRLDAEQEAKQRAHAAAMEAAEDRRRERERAIEVEERRAKAEADRRRIDELAAAYRAREEGVSS